MVFPPKGMHAVWWTTVLGFACVGLGGCDRGRIATDPANLKQESSAPANATAASQDSVVRSGSFVSGEHPTQGTARVVLRGQRRFLDLDPAFSTSTSGPDLVVVFHRSEDVIGSSQPPAFPINDGDYAVLAPLQDYSGAQSYAIPDAINLDDYASVAIWCRRLNATFGAAALKP